MVGLVHPLIPVSGTGTGLSPLPSRERGLVGVVLFTRVMRHPSGLRVKSAMTGMSCSAAFVF